MTTPNSPTMKRSLSCNNTSITRINLGPSKVNLEKKRKMFLELIQNHRKTQIEEYNNHEKSLENSKNILDRLEIEEKYNNRIQK